MTKEQKITLGIATAISVFLGGALFVYYQLKSGPKRRLRKLANEDIVFWKGKKETNPEVGPVLQTYWKQVGLNYSLSQLQSSDFQQGNPWSAAYISSLIKRWSGSNQFRYSASHSNYVIQARQAKLQSDKKAMYWAFEMGQLPVEIGDILIRNRGSNATLSTITSGTLLHGDIVVEKKDSQIFLQGGNLSNSVQRYAMPVDKDGKIYGTFIAHLKLMNYA
jgi:hypothetical protein